MHVRAAPRVTQDLAYHPRPDGIPFYIVNRVEEVKLIQRTGKKPILPQMAATAVELVHIARIKVMRSANAFGHRHLIRRRSHDVHMIGHQAGRMNRQAILLGVDLQQTQIATSIIIDAEDVLAIVPPLRDCALPDGSVDVTTDVPATLDAQWQCMGNG